MQIEVKTCLNYRGKNYICIAIEQIDVLEIAKEDWASMKSYTTATENARFLTFDSDVFEVGDVIHRTGTRIMLECPGVDLQFIYSGYTIKTIKEKENEFIGTNESSVEGSDHKVESPGLGDTGGTGDGPEDIGKAGS